MIQLRPHQWDILLSMKKDKGKVIAPTGSGKTMCMIKDAQRYMFNLGNKGRKTIVIVAPRILLAEQLSSEFLEVIDNVKVLHVHSGETTHFSTTDSDTIKQWAGDNYRFNKLIFTTYHSLNRLQSAEIDVNTIYFDESHNSVSKNFFPAVEYYSEEANRCYYFTATPKHSLTPFKAGMNDEDVYGEVIADIPAPKLVDKGYILPPKVIIKEIDVEDEIINESRHIVDTIDDIEVDKILICARSTKQIVSLASNKFADEIAFRGYSLMYITSKTGAFIDGEKVSREEFFNVLHSWGKDSDKKFIVLHHSILSEGMNVRGLEAALFLRNMDVIGLSQTIGRVIRTGDVTKTYGLVVVPCYDRVGISTSRRVKAVVDTIFNKGLPAISTVKR